MLPRFAMLLLVVGSPLLGFEPPSPEVIRDALGPLDGEAPAVQRLLAPDGDFRPIAKPGPTDWLAVHHEAGQTFAEFRHGSANRPDNIRRVIYLLPLGRFAASESPSLDRLRQYAEAYFQLPAKVLPPVTPRATDFEPRENPHTGKRQWHTGRIMEFLQRRLPPDAFCLLGVTMIDLYPDPKWNFIFGAASLAERVGVYSFTRYTAGFFGRRPEPGDALRLMRESGKVLVHEAAHMFGLWHCVHFSCVLNGANHRLEAESHPQHLCPVCLRKLHHSVGFDPVTRYRSLLEFYRRAGWTEEATWVDRQLAKAGATN